MAEEYTTKIKIEADLTGGVQTAEQYDKIAKKAKELGAKGKAGAAEAEAGVKSLAKSVGFLRNALSGFGVVGLFTGLIAGINKIKESFQAASKQAEAMAKIQKQLGESKAIQGLAQQYDQLADSAAKAAASQNAALDQIDTDVSNRRRLDKTKMEADKQAELSALNPNDPDYAEKVAQVEAKYSAMGATMEASNAREDVVLQRQKLGVQADLKDQEATAQDAQSAKIRAQLAQAKRAQSSALFGSVDLNEADKGGMLDIIGKTLAQIFTGQWGRAAGATTEEGDKIRQQKAKEAADAELKIGELQEQLRKSEEKAAALRTEAGNIRTKRDSMGVALEATDIEMDLARRKGDAGMAKADAALAKKQADRFAEVEKTQDAVRAKALLESEKARLEQQIAAQQQRKADAGTAVFFAQGALSNAQANGDRRGTAAAAQGLADAESTAQSVEFSAGQLINRLTNKLKQVESLLNKANSAIEKNNSQRLAQQAESLTSN